MNHPFVDGNKRVGFFATATFLRLNGLRFDLDQADTFDWLHARFATGTLRVDTLRAWIADHVVPDSAS